VEGLEWRGERLVLARPSAGPDERLALVEGLLDTLAA
jgi:hypothetical protein